jgi:hypothetical protein
VQTKEMEEEHILASNEEMLKAEELKQVRPIA